MTRATAEALRLKVGSEVHVRTHGADLLAVRIVGIAEPGTGRRLLVGGPAAAHPGARPEPGRPRPAPVLARHAAAGARGGPVLLEATGAPQTYWQFAADPSRLTGRDVAPLKERVASLEHGPALVGLRAVTGRETELATDVDTLLGGFGTMRAAVAPVVAVAAFGIGTVAAVVVAMTGGLAAARRREELALLRSRGASCAAWRGGCWRRRRWWRCRARRRAGRWPAWPYRTGGRSGGAAAAAVALAACLALPVRALAAHRTPHPAGGRRISSGRSRPGGVRSPNSPRWRWRWPPSSRCAAAGRRTARWTCWSAPPRTRRLHRGARAAAAVPAAAAARGRPAARRRGAVGFSPWPARAARHGGGVAAARAADGADHGGGRRLGARGRGRRPRPRLAAGRRRGRARRRHHGRAAGRPRGHAHPRGARRAVRGGGPRRVRPEAGRGQRRGRAGGGRPGRLRRAGPAHGPGPVRGGRPARDGGERLGDGNAAVPAIASPPSPSGWPGWTAAERAGRSGRGDGSVAHRLSTLAGP
ncbi:hypothetical protein NKH77_18715 [Streptomyces sp. M19]